MNAVGSIRTLGGKGGIMSSEAYAGRSGAGCGQREVLKSAVPGVVAGPPVAVPGLVAGLLVASMTFNFWNAGPASRRLAG